MNWPAILEVLRWIHIPAGLLALAVFLVPLLTRKGSRTHRAVGWVFVNAMAVASVTAAALAVVRFIVRQQSGAPLTLTSIAGPLFLLNVAALTGVSVHHGIAVLRRKSPTAAPPAWPVVLPAITLVALSIVTIVVGVVTRDPVLLTLPVVGLFVGAQYALSLRRAASNPMWWWFQHMTGMFGGCIAAATAVLITNARHITPTIPAPQWLFWIAPTLVGLPALFIWQQVYRRRFNATRRQASPEARGTVPSH